MLLSETDTNQNEINWETVYSGGRDSHGESASLSDVQMGRNPSGNDFLSADIITCIPWSLTTHCQLGVQDLQDVEIISIYDIAAE